MNNPVEQAIAKLKSRQLGKAVTESEVINDPESELQGRLERALKAPKSEQHDILYGSDPADVILLSTAMRRVRERKPIKS
jgi:hypothetical protein